MGLKKKGCLDCKQENAKLAPRSMLRETKMENDGYRYAVGDWESLWPCEPYMKHRIVLDRTSRTVVAGQDRRHKCWTPMTEADRQYMEQLILETHGWAFDDPTELGLMSTNEVPAWAMAAWPWPREQDTVTAQDSVDSIVELRLVGRGRRERLRLVKVLRVRSSDDANSEDDVADFEDDDGRRAR
jgi:hypothetical protein